LRHPFVVSGLLLTLQSPRRKWVMKRFHIHAHVADLEASIAFYSKMFATERTRVEGDHAKRMLDDPRINFAISTRGSKLGVDHLGIQTDTEEELATLKAQAEAADLTLQDVGETTCCHARSDKYWVTDPQGIAWAGFGRMFSDSFAGIAPSSAAGFVASELVGAGLAVAVHKFFAGAPVAPNTNSAVGERSNA
jgi:lactoylglutathione lyase